MRVTWRSAVVALAIVMLGGWFVQQSLADDTPTPAIEADASLPAAGDDGADSAEQPGTRSRADAAANRPRAERGDVAGHGPKRHDAKGDQKGGGRPDRGDADDSVEEVTPQPQDVEDDHDDDHDGDDDGDDRGDDRGDD